MSLDTNSIPWDEATQPYPAEKPLSVANQSSHFPATSPRLRLDDQGRLIPLNDAEKKAKIVAVRRMIEEINQIPNDPGEDDRDFFRIVDSQRPHRPLFEGLY